MNRKIPFEKIQPCLLDRLSDDSPQKSDESKNDRTISISKYRESVLRDIVWLLNTAKHTDFEDFSRLEYVDSSGLNYGVAHSCGLGLNGDSIALMERNIKRAIEKYEPRLNRRSLKVSFVKTHSKSVKLGFTIEGEMWANPVPERFFVNTKVDMETGEFSL